MWPVKRPKFFWLNRTENEETKSTNVFLLCLIIGAQLYFLKNDITFIFISYMKFLKRFCMRNSILWLTHRKSVTRNTYRKKYSVQLGTYEALAKTIAIFKKKQLSIICPPVKSIFGIRDPTGLSYLTQLRAGLRKLKFHKFNHNVRDTINLMCPTNDGIADTEQFCCFALPLRFNAEIFSFEFLHCYDHLDM